MLPIILSGGAPGSDRMFDNIGHGLGYEIQNMSFKGHGIDKKILGNIIVLSQEEIIAAYDSVKIGAKRLGKNPPAPGYVGKLICRNWHQLTDSDGVYAMTTISKDYRNADGGTGWAVAMAIEIKKIPVYVYDRNILTWFAFDYKADKFDQVTRPTIDLSFNKITGIGSRISTSSDELEIQFILNERKNMENK